MTDERAGALLPLLRRVPPGTGVVFRHHATARAERLRLFRQARGLAIGRRLILVAGGDRLPWPMRHGGPAPVTAPAHDRREAVAAVRRGAALLFVSPVYPTRSHPGAPALGVRRALGIGRGLPVIRIALGGMDARRWRMLDGFEGWAAIDAWNEPGATRQKRKAVPT